MTTKIIKQTNRMRIVTLILTSFLVITNLKGQINYSWVNSISSNSSEFVSKILTGSSGNVYIQGDFAGTADFDPSATNFYMTPSNSNNNYNSFIAKYTPNGTLIWAKRLGNTTGDSKIYDFILDINENIYVSGAFNGTIDFDLNATTYTLNSTETNNGQVFFAKYDQNCNFIAATSNSLVITLFTGATGNINLFNNTLFCTINSGNYNTHLLKYNNIGNLLISRTFTSSGLIRNNEIAFNSLGDVVLVGNFQSNVNLDPNVTDFSLSASGYYIMVSCYDSNLNFKWGQKIGGGTALYNKGNSLVIDNSNNIYLTGSDEGNIHLSKWDVNGTLMWYNKLGPTTSMFTTGISIRLSCSNKLFVSGFFTNGYGPVDFDPSPSTFTVSQTLGNNGKMFFASYNTNDCSFNNCIGLAENTYIKTTYIDPNNNIFVGGTFLGAPDFDPGPAVITYSTDFTYGDAFFGKYNGCLVSGIFEQNKSDISIKLFPNPTTDKLEINIEVNESFKFEIYNSLSQLVSIGSSNSNKTKIDVGDYSSGVYFIKINQGNNFIVSKFIKD